MSPPRETSSHRATKNHNGSRDNPEHRALASLHATRTPRREHAGASTERQRKHLAQHRRARSVDPEAGILDIRALGALFPTRVSQQSPPLRLTHFVPASPSFPAFSVLLQAFASALACGRKCRGVPERGPTSEPRSTRGHIGCGSPDKGRPQHHTHNTRGQTTPPAGLRRSPRSRASAPRSRGTPARPPSGARQHPATRRTHNG